MKKCPKCDEIYANVADTCPKCNIDLDTGGKAVEENNPNIVKENVAEKVIRWVIAFIVAGLVSTIFEAVLYVSFAGAFEFSRYLDIVVFMVTWYFMNKVLTGKFSSLNKDSKETQNIKTKMPLYCPQCKKGYDSSWKVCLTCNVPLKETNQ